jgi:hypothetical protein
MLKFSQNVASYSGAAHIRTGTLPIFAEIKALEACHSFICRASVSYPPKTNGDPFYARLTRRGVLVFRHEYKKLIWENNGSRTSRRRMISEF